MKKHISSISNDKKFLLIPSYKQCIELIDEEFDCNEDFLYNSIYQYIKFWEDSDSHEFLTNKGERYGLFLNVSNLCNTRCIYCFAHQGNYGNENALMNFNIAKQAVN